MFVAAGRAIARPAAAAASPGVDELTRILERCDELARFSEEEGLITRWYGSRSLVEAADAVAGWMEAAGLAVRRDAVGNVIGRAGAGEGTFVLGSHIDTVRDAGRYDGPLGVILAIEAAEQAGDLPLRSRWSRSPTRREAAFRSVPREPRLGGPADAGRRST